MRRIVLAIPAAAAVLAALASAAFFLSDEEASSVGRTAMLAERKALLRSGAARHDAWLRAERSSLRMAERAGDRRGVVIHGGRVAAAGGTADPLAAARAASDVLARDARELGRRPLLVVEAHAMGAGLAFDGVRDALWETSDRGLVGSIDERVSALHDVLDRHRRGGGFVPASRLGAAERRRLAEALDALAYRLGVAADRLG